MSIEELSLELNSVQLQDEQALEQFRIRFLGSKNVLKDLYAAIKDIPTDQKRAYGQQVNALKEQAEQIFHGAKAAMTEVRSTGPAEDLSKPVGDAKVGAHHPLSLIRREIIEIFNQVGFVVSEGPEIEDDWHNFSALNFAPEHPARDMQDTFFIQTNPDILLRTHTSSVQVRYMENNSPPIRTISPGRVYRNEAISSRAHCFFHQVEGLYIDKNVSFADLKQTLDYFAKSFFGEKAKIRLRPSYFPFTEPSAEVDVSCTICNAKGCNVCKYTGWLEILGCGMVDPNVLKASGIDPEIYTGFAFGMGIERIAQLKFKVSDLRLYSENDVRFLSQFAKSI